MSALPELTWSRRLFLALFCTGMLILTRDRIEFELGYACEYGNFHGLIFPRDQKMAATWPRRAAQLGHARAQYLLALSYSRGWGVKQDDVMAERWFSLSAEQAYAPACFHLAWMLHKGEGVALDEARARRLMAQAEALGMGYAAQASANWAAARKWPVNHTQTVQ